MKHPYAFALTRITAYTGRDKITWSFRRY